MFVGFRATFSSPQRAGGGAALHPTQAWRACIITPV